MPDSRKPTAADHAWAEQQARQIEAAMTEAVEGDLEKRLRYAADLEPLQGFLAGDGSGSLRRMPDLLRDAADEIERLRAALSRAEAALEPFARLATEEGRAPFKLNSIDTSTTDGLSFDNSSDDAQIPLRVRVGDIRAAHAACLSRCIDTEKA